MGLAALAKDRWRWPAAAPLPPLDVRSGPEPAGWIEDYVVQVLEGQMVIQGRWAPAGLDDPRRSVLRIMIRERSAPCFVTEFREGRVRLLVPV